MLDKPRLPDARILECLQEHYGLGVDTLTFLPLGADRNTAVYHARANDAAPYFVKLRGGIFDPVSVALPKFLGDRGIAQIIVPITAKSGALSVPLAAYTLILYPFVEGQDAYARPLSDAQWVELGVALKRIHSTVLPAALRSQIPIESFSPQACDRVKQFVDWSSTASFNDPSAAGLVTALKRYHVEILALVERTNELASVLHSQSLEFTVCHSDLHAANLLIQSDGTFYIVDWDAPLFAPRERDLMYIGGGQFGSARLPAAEQALFYRGYGVTAPNPLALAYYRYRRIVDDIDVECELIWYNGGGAQDRARELEFLKSNFVPGGTLEIAYNADTTRAQPSNSLS